ncbi:MAG: SDR family NAD(P)-dependent oxidoreductase, partial [Deltaproteobacteria bacterium]
MKEKKAIVTGAGQGIGRGIALKMAREGADIVVAEMNPDTGAQTTREIADLGRKALFINVDVANLQHVQGLVEQVLNAWGRVDVLVNNAGFDRPATLLKVKGEDWDAVLRVNLKGTFLFSRAVSKVMMKQRSGAIVNIASVIGLIGNAGQANYAASKAGMIALTKSTARELASRGVRANAIAPGF